MPRADSAIDWPQARRRHLGAGVVLLGALGQDAGERRRRQQAAGDIEDVGGGGHEQRP